MGFFYEQAADTFRWSSSTLGSMDLLASNDLVVEIGGTYLYYCYVLADFDPIKAKEFEAKCSVEDITNALMAREAFNKPKNN